MSRGLPPWPARRLPAAPQVTTGSKTVPSRNLGPAPPRKSLNSDPSMQR
jgi:hypothetical protein